MKIRYTPLKDVVVVESVCHDDSRGHFQELYSHDKCDDPAQQNWKQINWSHSKSNVLRGIHCAPYQKLVMCLSGRVWDVVVDLRKDSKTYLEWYGMWLDHKTQMFVPGGCGHGYYAEEESDVVYMQNCAWDENIESNYHWMSFGIEWPESEEYVISDKDENAKKYGYG